VDLVCRLTIKGKFFFHPLLFKSLEFNFIPLKKKKYKINVPILFKQMPINPVFGYFSPGSASNTYEMANK